MKKNRNTFFQESSYQSYNPNMANIGGAPYQTASNYYYQGPVPGPVPGPAPMNQPINQQMQPNYNIGYNSMQNNNNDIESRLAKIERQLNRIDYRLTKLENANTTITSDDFDSGNTTNMYML